MNSTKHIVKEIVRQMEAQNLTFNSQIEGIESGAESVEATEYFNECSLASSAEEIANGYSDKRTAREKVATWIEETQRLVPDFFIISSAETSAR